MGKTAKMLIKMNFGAKSHFCVPRARFSPKTPRVLRLEVYKVISYGSYQLSSNIWKILLKSNGQIKSYEAKVSFLAIFVFWHFWYLGLFWPFLSPYPLGTQLEFFFQKSKNTIPLVKRNYTFMQNFKD